MKAVLCLWAREHLKGRPGPGSGLALLLKKLRRKKKKKQHSPLCMCACMCVWQRAAKPDGRDTLRIRSGAVVDAEERPKRGFASPLPDVPAAPAGPRQPRQVRPAERSDKDAEEESRPCGEAPRKDFSEGFLPPRACARGAAFTCTRPPDYYLGGT